MTSAALAPSDGALLDSVGGIKWPARTASPAGVPGSHGSRILGIAPELTEYRAYRPGDEVRRIDWKLLARSDRAYIRLSDDRTVLATVIVVDASASLAYPSASVEKWHYARSIALGLASAAHTGGDPIGLLVATSDGARRLAARTRRGVVHEIARVLHAVHPAGSEPVAPLLGHMGTIGRIAIVSDFLGDSGETLAAAARLRNEGREIYAIHVLHEDEIAPSRKTRLLIDPEDPNLRRPVNDQARKKYLEAFGQWREKIARDWRMQGAYYEPVVTNEPIARAVRRIVTPR